MNRPTGPAPDAGAGAGSGNAIWTRRGRDVRDLIMWSVVGILLSGPIIGITTETEYGGLAVYFRVGWAILFAAAFPVFAWLLPRIGRRLWTAARARWGGPGGNVDAGAAVGRITTYVAPIAIAFGMILPFLPFADRYILDVAILVVMYIMLGWGLNIVVGLAGLLDLGYVAFYAVGAYSYALLALHFGMGFWECLPIAGAFAAMFGIILGFPVLRLRGDYLAIVTLGFGEMIRIILINWYSLTNGPDGVSGIPRPSFFGLLEFSRYAPEGGAAFHEYFGLEYSSLHRIIFLYYLILVLALLTNAFTLRIRKLPVGRAWEALREDEIASRSLGINPRNTKLTAFSLGAMFGGFAGAFFATRQGFISPESFTFIESAVILMIVVLGGRGSQLGVVLAALLVIGIPEFFRDLQEYRMLVFGAAMVLIMRYRPQGLLAYREPTLRLEDRDGGGGWLARLRGRQAARPEPVGGVAE